MSFPSVHSPSRRAIFNWSAAASERLTERANTAIRKTKAKVVIWTRAIIESRSNRPAAVRESDRTNLTAPTDGNDVNGQRRTRPAAVSKLLSFITSHTLQRSRPNTANRSEAQRERATSPGHRDHFGSDNRTTSPESQRTHPAQTTDTYPEPASESKSKLAEFHSKTVEQTERTPTKLIEHPERSLNQTPACTAECQSTESGPEDRLKVHSPSADYLDAAKRHAQTPIFSIRSPIQTNTSRLESQTPSIRQTSRCIRQSPRSIVRHRHALERNRVRASFESPSPRAASGETDAEADPRSDQTRRSDFGRSISFANRRNSGSSTTSALYASRRSSADHLT